MPRGHPARIEELEEVVAAATRVFTRKGYRQTRMSDVAAEAGVSTGALYTYVEGKEALFHLVVTGERPTGLPVPTPDLRATVRAVGVRLAAATEVTNLASRSEGSGPPDDPAAELAAIVGQMYDVLEANRTVLGVVERSATELPDLEDRYYRRGRRAFVGDLTEYLELRIADGSFRSVPDPAVTARYLIETVAWFAWHRHGDPDSAMIADAVAKATVVDMAVAALVIEGS